MKFILLTPGTQTTLAAMISVRYLFSFEGHPNTEWIIYLLQKYLAGNRESQRDLY